MAEIAAEEGVIRAGEPISHGTHLCLRAGRYAEQIRRYLDVFGAKNVKVLVFERFVRNQQGSYDAVCHGAAAAVRARLTIPATVFLLSPSSRPMRR